MYFKNKDSDRLIKGHTPKPTGLEMHVKWRHDSIFLYTITVTIKTPRHCLGKNIILKVD